MRAVRRSNATGAFSWIGSDGWSARSLVSDGSEPEVEGTLSVQPQANPVKGFKDYFLNLTVDNNERNPWFVGKLILYIIFGDLLDLASHINFIWLQSSKLICYLLRIEFVRLISLLSIYLISFCPQWGARNWPLHRNVLIVKSSLHPTGAPH